jgi:hypothetical protein
MKFTRSYLLLFLCYGVMACNSSNVNDKIHNASEKAGKAVSEVAKGVSEGVKSSFGVTITRVDTNSLKTIDIGKVILKSKDGKDNMLSVYIIFKKDFSRRLMIKAYDNKGLEMGRIAQLVTGKKEEARFVDFVFDKRTNIDNNNKVTIE